MNISLLLYQHTLLLLHKPLMPQGINNHDNNNRCFCFSLFQNKTTNRRVRWQVRRTDITPVWQFCRRLPNAARQHVTLIRICVLNWKSGPEQGQRKEEKQRKWKKETKKERKGELKKKESRKPDGLIIGADDAYLFWRDTHHSLPYVINLCHKRHFDPVYWLLTRTFGQ